MRLSVKWRRRNVSGSRSAAAAIMSICIRPFWRMPTVTSRQTTDCPSSLFKRDAKALHRRALLTRKQAQRTLDNLSQLFEVDVRTAYIEVNRTKEQIPASSVTRMFDEEKLRTENEKLSVGKSTSFRVAQAQRDLLVSRIAEVRALANYLKALIDLYRQDGSLLERHKISSSGREPVELSKR
ncbi:MAG: TolC family protein [Deltaproteobacteria bacterium]|nr:TolC family protein [Deltaproteobacteria bacterium]